MSEARPTPTETVRVDLSSATADRGYNILIGSGLLATAHQLCSAACKIHHAILISDKNVAKLYAEPLREHFDAAGTRTDLFVVDAGERSKAIEVATRLWNEVLASAATRKSTIIAVGGGVVGDLAGFIAASYARGLEFIQLPTTLLAQVDSSVGGKVAINLPDAKNMVGFFWQPKLVLADLDTLDTLPDREYFAGMAEVIKYGMIADEALFTELESRAPSLVARDKSELARVVARCCQIKADVVQEDERETSGRRAILNYGHTIGHALESVSDYGALLHGEAIAIGMHYEALMAEKRGMIDGALVQRQQALFQTMKLPTALPNLNHDAIWEAITRDKKADSTGVRFILPTKLGDVEFVERVEKQEVLAALK